MSDIPTKPEDYGVKIPKLVNEDLFRQGFAHSIQGGKLTDIKLHFKKSFGEGFRTARLLARNTRRSYGVVDFPMKGKIKVRCY